jgi:hypothetical protein
VRQRPLTLHSKVVTTKMQLNINVEKLSLNHGCLTAAGGTLILQRTSGVSSDRIPTYTIRDGAGGQLCKCIPTARARRRASRDAGAGPTSQRQKHGARPVSRESARANRPARCSSLAVTGDFPAMPYTLRIGAGSEQQKTYPLVSQTESA